MVISGSELRRQAAIRGWDQRALARQAGVSEATVSRAVAGRGVRGVTALKLVQALRRSRPVPELEQLILVQSIKDGTANITRRSQEWTELDAA
jgi:DNA-binding MurR/RpiR family transcriptional regulator